MLGLRSAGEHACSRPPPPAPDIPWDTIRALSDPQFAAEMAQAAAHNALRIGATLRTLRRPRGLTTAEMGRRTGMAQRSISRLEKGHHAISFSTPEKILAAMGCTLNDLQESESLRIGWGAGKEPEDPEEINRHEACPGR